MRFDRLHLPAFSQFSRRRSENLLHFYRDLSGFNVVSPEKNVDGAVAQMAKMPRVHMREYRLRPSGGIDGYERSCGLGFAFDIIQSMANMNELVK